MHNPHKPKVKFYYFLKDVSFICDQSTNQRETEEIKVCISKYVLCRRTYFHKGQVRMKFYHFPVEYTHSFWLVFLCRLGLLVKLTLNAA